MPEGGAALRIAGGPCLRLAQRAVYPCRVQCPFNGEGAVCQGDFVVEMQGQKPLVAEQTAVQRCERCGELEAGQGFFQQVIGGGGLIGLAVGAGRLLEGLILVVEGLRIR